MFSFRGVCGLILLAPLCAQAQPAFTVVPSGLTITQAVRDAHATDEPVTIAEVRKLKQGGLQIAYRTHLPNVKLEGDRSYLEDGTTTYPIRVLPSTQLNGVRRGAATITLEVRDATDVVWTDVPTGYAAPNNRQVLASSYALSAERGRGMIGPTIQLASLLSPGTVLPDPEPTLVATLNTPHGAQAEVYGQADRNRMLKLSLPEPVLPAGTYTGYTHLLKDTENVPMTLTVRHPAWWAVLTLLAGLLTAAIIAWVRNRWSPTAEWRAEIGRLLASAPQDCSPPKTTPPTNYDVLTAYTGQLRALDHRLRREAWSAHSWLDPLGLAPQLTKLRQELEQLAQTPQAWQAFVQSLTELARLSASLKTKLQASGDGHANVLQVIEGVVQGGPIQPADLADEHRKINETALRAQTFEADPPQEYLDVLKAAPPGSNSAQTLSIAIAGLRQVLHNPGNTNLARLEKDYVKQVWGANNAVAQMIPAGPVAAFLGFQAQQSKFASAQLRALQLVEVPAGFSDLTRSRNLEAARLWVGILLFVIVLAVTLISGLETLYLPNSTFGASAWDYLKTFLWGIGITAGVTAVLQGISGVRSTFSLGSTR